MRGRLGRRVVVVMVVATLVGVAAPGTASAKKNRVIASFNGKRHRWKGRFVVANTNQTIGTVIAAANGARPGGLVRALGFGCGAVYLPTATLPVTPPSDFCTANYTEERVSRHPAAKGWLALQSIQVTYESFDGTRVTGTFAGVLDPVPGNPLPAVTIQGSFDTTVTVGQ